MRGKRSFKINGNKWKIKMAKLDADIDGETDQTQRTVTLSTALAEKDYTRVFVHEFMHAMLFELHLSGPTGVLNEDIEEIICEGVTNILLSNFDIQWKSHGKRKP